MKRRIWWLGGLIGVAVIAAACGEGGEKKEAAHGAAPAVSDSTVGAKSSSAESAQQAGPGAAARSQASASGQAQPGGGALPATGQQQTAEQPLPGTDRKIVYNVFLDLTVKDVQTGFERIATIAESNGGLVAESNVRQEGDQRRASITVRVPAGRYQDVLGQIRGLATRVESERSTGNDVTEEFTDLQSRQRNLEATEQQLLVFLGQAKNIQEVLQVQDRINSVRAEIERVKGRMNLLGRLSELATIQVQLRPEAAPAAKKDEPATSPLTAVRRGWEASAALLGGLAFGALVVAGFSWWLLPLGALALWLWRRQLRRRGAAAPVPAAASPGPHPGSAP